MTPKEEVFDLYDLFEGVDSGDVCVSHAVERLKEAYPNMASNFGFFEMLFHEGMEMVLQHFKRQVEEAIEFNDNFSENDDSLENPEAKA